MLVWTIHGKCLTLLVCVVISSVYSNSEWELCSSQPSSLHLSVDNNRNQKGNWVPKVDLEREGRRHAARTGPWAMDVDSNTRTCEGGVSTLHVTVTLAVPLPKADLAAGYELSPGLGYYKFHNNATTWGLARQTCAEEGAHLAIINSEKESEVMKSLFAQFPTILGSEHPHFAWIGFKEKGNDFFTIFGEGLNSTGFMRWSPGEPDSSPDGCGFLNRSNGGLGDAACSLKFAFICEQGI